MASHLLLVEKPVIAHVHPVQVVRVQIRPEPLPGQALPEPLQVGEGGAAGKGHVREEDGPAQKSKKRS